MLLAGCFGRVYPAVETDMPGVIGSIADAVKSAVGKVTGSKKAKSAPRAKPAGRTVKKPAQARAKTTGRRSGAKKPVSAVSTTAAETS